MKNLLCPNPVGIKVCPPPCSYKTSELSYVNAPISRKITPTLPSGFDFLIFTSYFCEESDFTCAHEVVARVSKINPIIMSQIFIESMDYDLEHVERLPNSALRILQYRFDFYKVYPEYSIVLFTVSEISKSKMI